MAALGPLSEGAFLSILTLHNTLFESTGPAKGIATRQEIFDRNHFYRPPLHCYGRYPDVYVCSNTMSTHKLLPRQCTRELDVSQPHRPIFIPQLLPTNFNRGYPNHIFADDNIFPSSSWRTKSRKVSVGYQRRVVAHGIQFGPLVVHRTTL